MAQIITLCLLYAYQTNRKKQIFFKTHDFFRLLFFHLTKDRIVPTANKSTFFVTNF